MFWIMINFHKILHWKDNIFIDKYNLKGNSKKKKSELKEAQLNGFLNLYFETEQKKSFQTLNEMSRVQQCHSHRELYL